MKTIFGLYGPANVGKTTSLKKLYSLLISNYPMATVRHGSETLDVRAVLDIKGFLIGIESQGGPNSRIFESLKLFVEEGCSIIETGVDRNLGLFSGEGVGHRG